VVMNGDDIEAVPAKRLENRCHFAFEHRDVTGDCGDCGLLVRAGETPPTYSAPYAR
jgi:hypothetical protein